MAKFLEDPFLKLFVIEKTCEANEREYEMLLNAVVDAVNEYYVERTYFSGTRRPVGRNDLARYLAKIRIGPGSSS